MAEILAKYDALLRGHDGRIYAAHACGRPRGDGMWEGWLEFPASDGVTVRTGRETTQPNRDAIVYWAGGLTAGYLDGALLRATTPAPELPESPPETPAFDGPAPRSARPSTAAPPVAVLDPFAVYAQGDAVLQGQLAALSPSQLRNIIRAYGLSLADAATLDGLPTPDLIAIIMAAVRGA